MQYALYLIILVASSPDAERERIELPAMPTRFASEAAYRAEGAERIAQASREGAPRIANMINKTVILTYECRLGGHDL